MIIIYDTKIKYLKVMDKLYRVADISFYYKTIRAVETGHQIADVPEQVIFEISDFADFKITLVNNNGLGEILDFEKYRQNREMKL